MNALSTHTSSGCTMQTSGFYGTFMMQGSQKTDCDARATNSQGCGVRSKSKVSYGPACQFDFIACLVTASSSADAFSSLSLQSTRREEESMLFNGLRRVSRFTSGLATRFLPTSELVNPSPRRNGDNLTFTSVDRRASRSRSSLTSCS